MFPFLPDDMINDLQMLQGDLRGSFFVTVVSGRVSGGPCVSFPFWVLSISRFY